jgi:hypothetical protein
LWMELRMAHPTPFANMVGADLRAARSGVLANYIKNRMLSRSENH